MSPLTLLWLTDHVVFAEKSRDLVLYKSGASPPNVGCSLSTQGNCDGVWVMSRCDQE